VPKNRLSQLGMPVAIVAIVVMMVVPLPTIVLDLLIVLNIGASIIVLLVSMNVTTPLDFSIFPSLILVLTIFRLAINVSTTRLVLTDGYAGKVIEAFGHLVIGGSIIIGLVVFLILITIQFVVITNGAGRVAEVGARFTLDAMPGKQMAIDADLNSGLIDESEAKLRRKQIAMESDFYGAMDGASKFVKGDAIAAVVIVTINLFGGFAIGVLQNGMDIGQAIETYSLLSVGDGLVSQIPALLLSMATGIIVTRAATEADLGTDLFSQFGRQRRAMQVAGGALCALAVVPGMPKIPFVLVGGLLLLIAARVPKEGELPVEEAVEDAEPTINPESPEAIVAGARVDPLELQVSFDLIDLVDPSRGGDLLDRVRALRKKIATDLGFVIPLVRTRDNLDLPQNCYAIRVHGVEVARGEAPPGHVLVIGDDIEALPGIPGRDPVFGLEARWTPLQYKEQAELNGNTVVDRASVVTTHLAETVRRYAADLLSRQDVQMLVDMVKHTDPVVVEELTPALLSLGEIQQVLQALLREGVSVNDLVRIFEAISEKGRTNKDPEALTEAARQALGPGISAQHAIDGRLPVITMEPLIEHTLLESLRQGDGGTFLAMDPEYAERLVIEVARAADDASQRGDVAVLLCSPQLRAALHKLVRTAAPNLPVLSYAELGDQLRIDTTAVVNIASIAPV